MTRKKWSNMASRSLQNGTQTGGKIGRIRLALWDPLVELCRVCVCMSHCGESVGQCVEGAAGGQKWAGKAKKVLDLPREALEAMMDAVGVKIPDELNDKDFLSGCQKTLWVTPDTPLPQDSNI